MNRLREQMEIIPRAAWAVAVIFSVCVITAMLLYSSWLFHDDEGSVYLPPGMIVIGTLIVVSMFIYTLVIGYIAGDARRRGMRVVLWVLLAIFIPNAIGIILYFILREPLLRACPKCGTPAKTTFPFCPSCGMHLAQTCPSCQSAVEPGWSHCARCGANLAVAPIRHEV